MSPMKFRISENILDKEWWSWIMVIKITYIIFCELVESYCINMSPLGWIVFTRDIFSTLGKHRLFWNLLIWKIFIRRILSNVYSENNFSVEVDSFMFFFREIVDIPIRRNLHVHSIMPTVITAVDLMLPCRSYVYYNDQ